MDRDEALADAESANNRRRLALPDSGPSANSKVSHGEYAPLHNNSKLTNYDDEPSSYSVPRSGAEDEADTDFFKVILSEIEKVNKFFVG